MIYRIFGLLSIVLLIVGSILLSGPQSETATLTVEAPARDSGYAARKAQLVETGPDGHPLYTLIADLIRQLPNEGVVLLERVQMTFRDSAGNLWTARAEHGELGQDSGKVALTGGVHVVGVLPGAEQPGDITTDRLAFDTRAQIVSTDDPVTVVWSGYQLNAHRLLANLKEHHLQLESAVHGNHTP